MDALVAEGIVISDSVAFVESRAGRQLIEVNLRGRVETVSGAVLTVNKWLEVDIVRGRVNVRTREYDYHAHMRDATHHNLFRYDNCHGGVDTLHKHVFDLAGREFELRPIEQETMPPLNLVVREADFCGRWLLDHR